ncbi:MAG: zinc-binding dehydrogenase [Gammaproteobacteria bacterium]|nr:zinc-binding dehydrogenase [Gammaproteobacteria bacterium]MCZ6676657.1 zinc-binding dehydrogenase [Candidatus Poribacteria bacterium]
MLNLGIEFPEQGVAGLFDLGSAPEPGPAEILIRTQYSGVTNGTERHAMMGDFNWKSYPGRHGYQHVGIVEKTGSAVSGFQEGDRLFFGRYVGHRGWHVQEVDDADTNAYRSHLCLPLPDDVDPELCALFGVAGVAMRAVRRCRVADGHRVWVVGAGLIGQFAAQAARAFGAQVAVTDVIDKRLEIAEKAGAHRVLNATKENTYQALQEGGPYDRIIDASGYPPLFAEVHEHNLLAYRGVIGAIAVRGDTVFPWSMFHGREASIEVSCHFSLDDLQVVLHFVRRGTIQIEPLVLHRAPVTEAPKLYEMLRDHREEMLGIVFQWDVNLA